MCATVDAADWQAKRSCECWGAGPMPPACEIFRDPFGFLFAMPFRVFLVPVLYGDDATDELNAFMASHRVVHIERRWDED